MATGTAIEVVMPQMGVSVSEGTITKWLKQEGEHVEADEALLEISTDKVDTEVPSPGSGIVQQILVQEGETVEVGTKLAVIAPEGSDGAQPQAPPEAATQPAADASMAAASEGVGDVAPSSQDAASAAQQAAPAPAENGRTFVSPVVARIAAENNVDPSRVQGTGRGGRVTKKDILDYIEAGAQAEARAPAEAPRAPEPVAPAPAAPEPPPAAAPQPAPTAAPKREPAPVAEAGEPAQGESFEPVTAMRRGIAEHMRRSLDTAAHVTSAMEVD